MRGLAVILLLLAPLALRAAVVHVAPGGTGDGSSWAQARGSLTAALAAAAAGDQVWIAQGTWKPGATRASTFTVPAGVAVYGGFLGGESDPAQRPGTPGLTVLSGEIGAAAAGDNCYHVVTLAAGGAHRLDGLTITGGYADGGGSSAGGGIHAASIGNLLLTDCAVAGNAADSCGGGLSVLQGGDVTLTRCRFTGNTTPGTGSAIYLAQAGALVWNDVQVTGNAFPGGMGYSHVLVSQCASCVLERCVVAANTGVGWLGTAAPALQVASTPLTLRSCLVAGNQAGGIDCNRALLMEGCTVAGNAAGLGALNTQLTTATTPPLPAIAIRTSIIGTPYVLSLPPAADQRTWLTDVQGDPGFLDPANPAGADGVWLTADDGFQLAAASAALGWARMAVPGADPALGAVDLRGLPRPQGREPEPGCYERAQPGGRAPVALGQSVSVPEDTPQVLLTVGGGDADGDAVSARILALPAAGTLWPTTDGLTASGGRITAAPFTIPGGGRSVLYRPPGDAFASPLATIPAELDDGAQTSYPVDLAVTVTPVNDPPVLDALVPFIVAEDSGSRSVLVTGIADSAAGNEGQALTVSATSSEGTLVNIVAVTYTSPATYAWLSFAPLPDAFGSTTITVTVADAAGASASRAFVLDVMAVNDPPVFSAISERHIPEDCSDPALLSLVLGGIAPGPFEAGQALSVTAVSTDQSLLRIGAIDTSRLAAQGMATVQLAPQPDANGTALVYLTVFDDGGTAAGGGDNTTRLVRIIVDPVNDPPLPRVGSVTAAGTAAVLVGTAALDIADADAPPDASLVCSLAAAPAHGDLLLDGTPLAAGGAFTRADLVAGRLAYRPDPARPGAVDAFAVTVSDGIAPAVGPVGVPVALLPAGNQPPTVATAWLATAADAARDAVLAASDPDGDALSWSIAAAPRHGTLVLLDAAAGTCRWTPEAGWSGSDAAVVAVGDGVHPAVSATLALVVTGGDEARPQPVGDPPHAVAPGEELRAALLFTPATTLEFALGPDAPAGLRVTAAGAGRAALAWDAPAGLAAGAVVRATVVAVDVAGRAAAALPLTLVVRVPPRGGG